MPSKIVTDYQLTMSDGTSQKAHISCFNNGQFIGYIDFREDGNVVQSQIHSSGYYKVGFSINRFVAISTMLREESPIYLGINEFSSGLVRGYLTTSSEPVGEEEGV